MIVEFICYTDRGSVRYTINLSAKEIQKSVTSEETRVQVKNRDKFPPPYNCDVEPLDLEHLTTQNVLKFFEPVSGRWVVDDRLVRAEFSNREEFERCVWTVVNRVRKAIRNGQNVQSL